MSFISTLSAHSKKTKELSQKVEVVTRKCESKLAKYDSH